MHPTATDAPTPPRPSAAELAARVSALLPELAAGHPDFDVARLFLASGWTPNIDRLAAFLGLERERVARCARRWADHGLWGQPTQAALCAVRLGHALEVARGGTPVPPGTDRAPLSPREAAVEEPASSEALLSALWADLGLDARRHAA